MAVLAEQIYYKPPGPLVNICLWLASLHFWYLFLSGKLGLGTGMATRFAKAPAGITTFHLRNQKGFRKGRRGLRPASSYGMTTALYYKRRESYP